MEPVESNERFDSRNGDDLIAITNIYRRQEAQKARSRPQQKEAAQ